MPKPPAIRGQNHPTAKAVAGIPAIDPALYANIGRYYGAAVLTAFEQIGGVDQLAEWARDNQTDFYTKLMAKGMSAPKELQVSGTVNFRQALEALDLVEGQDYTNVEDGEVEE